MKRITDSLFEYIEKGTTIIHDGENSHSELIQKINANEIIHTTAETKGLSDKKNPMNQINTVHCFLKKFMAHHGGFKRDDLQDLLNVFYLINKCKGDVQKFVPIVLKKIVSCKKVLRYREQWNKKPSK